LVNDLWGGHPDADGQGWLRAPPWLGVRTVLQGLTEVVFLVECGVGSPHKRFAVSYFNSCYLNPALNILRSEKLSNDNPLSKYCLTPTDIVGGVYFDFERPTQFFRKMFSALGFCYFWAKPKVDSKKRIMFNYTDHDPL
jgi:hypothetical protein